MVKAARLGDDVAWHPQCFRYTKIATTFTFNITVIMYTDATRAASCW